MKSALSLSSMLGGPAPARRCAATLFLNLLVRPATLILLACLCLSAAAQTPNEWTWMSGSSTANQPGVYGTLGIPAPANVPGNRSGASSWTDASGNLWFFGGGIYDPNANTDSCGNGSQLNDLWEFNPSTNEWAWMSGSNTVGSYSQSGSCGWPGVYGTLGSPAAANVPGSRFGGQSWTDRSGNLWLFGGQGFDVNGNYGQLNDLWEFTPSTNEWAWMGGSNAMGPCNEYGTCGPPGVYGTLGQPAAGNIPGGRLYAPTWTDSGGNFWLFGGWAIDSNDIQGILNDLWEFSPSTMEWTWMGGGSACTPPDIYSACTSPAAYGTLGTPAAGNVPGGHYSSSSWTDSSGNLWLFGGGALTVDWGNYSLNDLWEFNPSSNEWTWMGGSSTDDQAGLYGTLATPAAGNIPGSRSGASNWTDSNGNFWLFGGGGYDANGALGSLNDLWEFAPAANEWEWMGGSSTVGSAYGQPGVYGMLGTPAPGNTPGGRSGATSWIDKSGDLWLLGGYGLDANSANGYLNDLWRYQLTATILPAAATPTFSVPAGSYSSTQTVTIGDATAGATIYYSTNGTAQAPIWTVYGGPITVSPPETLEAIAIASSYSTSAVATAAYTAAPVNGVCGTANGESFFAPPTANLCSAGTASAVTNPGSWTWACNGEYGGTNASCSATVTQPLAPAGADVILSQVNWLATYPNGAHWGSTAAAGTSFAVNSTNGNIVFSTAWGNTIEMLNPQTGVSTSLGTYTNAGGVTLDSNNNLYVGGEWSQTILKVPFVGGAYVSFADPGASGYTPPANCAGSDTAACVVAPLSDLGYFGSAAFAFDSEGDLFLATNDQGSFPHSIWECTAACLLTGAPAPVMLFQEPTGASPTTTGQLYVGGLAIDPWGNLFFTDSNLINQFYIESSNCCTGISSFSDLNELPVSSGAGYGGVTTGFAAMPAVLYSEGTATPTSYDNQVDGVAVDGKGTVYFVDQSTGIFAFPNNGGTLTEPSVASTMYTVSTQGAEMLTIDANNNLYAVGWSEVINPSGADTLAKITVNNLTVPASQVEVGTTNSATSNPVTTILNDGGCSTPETVSITSSTSEFSAAATNSCAWTLTGGSSFPTTITFTPAAVGNRSATLTATDSDGNTGTATVSGVGQAPNPPAATPTFSLAAGAYTSAQTVMIGDSTPGEVIYYTTNGTTPTVTPSEEYSTALTIANTTTVEALAAAPGYTNSPVATATYTILLPQTISFTQPASPVTYGVSPVTLVASGGASGNPVIFSVVSGPAKVSGT
ncbi:MAG: kelch repeat-containing protein, partial [Terracidiphilus sp.]